MELQKGKENPAGSVTVCGGGTIYSGKLRTLFERQEREDLERLTTEVKSELFREFVNAESVIDSLRGWGLSDEVRLHCKDMSCGSPFGNADIVQEKQWSRFLEYYRKHWTSLLKLSIEQAWIRTEAKFSIRKHTSSQIPYYHSHDFYEMIYVCWGSCSQYLNGEDGKLTMQAGEACILTPGMIHTILPCTPESLVLKLTIPAEDMKRILNEMQESKGVENGSDTSGFSELMRQQNEVFVFRAFQGSDLLQPFMERLLEESAENNVYREMMLHNLLSLLLIRLARNGQNQFRPDLLQKITSYIRRDLHTASLQELAGQMGYSTRQLRRRIQEKTGGTFSDILQRVRLEEAAALLRDTDLTVEEIAERTGYQSVSGIYKRFQTVFHMTPNAYRKKSGSCR